MADATRNGGKSEANGQKKFNPFDDGERRTWALKITEQVITNQRLEANLKKGRERVKKLTKEFVQGGYYPDDQPELPIGDEHPVTPEARS